jgi:hypothetical protein
VLLAALALLALAAALLVGTASASSRIARAGRSRAATLVADAESRQALASFVAAWGSSADALPVGGTLVTTTASTASVGAMPVGVRLRLQRLTLTRFVLAVECQVGPGSLILARRRFRLLLERAIVTDSTVPRRPPAPVAVWGLADLY